MEIRRDYVDADRIVIPGSSDRTKVRWNKRHLAHMAHIIPTTPEIQSILEELRKVGGQHGDAETWLFPSAASESGHMEEERAATLGLREHAGLRFTLHQLRHNFATAAEELRYSTSEIREILDQGAHPVTERYIDERVKRQRAQLIAIRQKIDGDRAPANSHH
jgi:integrase